MNNIIKKYIGKSSLMMAFALMATGTAMTSCSDDTLSNINTDKTKVSELDPNAQLTTALLQTYGDFSLMDTYRNYISGFPQYFAGGWNVTNYAGSNFREDDIARRVWDRYYEVSIKNLVDAIHNSADKANLNAALRIHRVYDMKDKLWGKRGTPEREAMENQLKEEVNAYFVGEAIRKARLAQKLTQEELGELIGVQRAQISKLEKGKSVITLPTMSRVFKALGIATATLDLGIAGKIALW